jgi:hypothetical protein
MWAKALKASEYLERLEKQETYKQRRQAEQAALNQRFFEPSRKREEPVLGVDISLPLLPEGMFSSRDESSLLEKVALYFPSIVSLVNSLPLFEDAYARESESLRLFIAG